MNLKCVIVAGQATQDHEFIYPFYRLQEAGYEVDVAVRGNEVVYGSIGSKIVPTCDIAGLASSYFDLVVVPGGAKAMEYMRQDVELIDFIREAHSKGSTIASICHGAQLLISAGLVRGREVSGYYSIRDDINNAGGIFSDEPFVVCDRIISSPHYKHLGAWMQATLQEVEIRGTGH